MGQGPKTLDPTLLIMQKVFELDPPNSKNVHILQSPRQNFVKQGVCTIIICNYTTVSTSCTVLPMMNKLKSAECPFSARVPAQPRDHLCSFN